MSRRRRQAKRQITDDPIYGLKSVSKFINALMIGGKKTTAEKIFYNSFSLIKDKSKEDPIKVFNEAIKDSKTIDFYPVEEYGIDGDFVESQAFGYLAIRSILKLPISFPNTTGCKKPISGGETVKNF